MSSTAYTLLRRDSAESDNGGARHKSPVHEARDSHDDGRTVLDGRAANALGAEANAHVGVAKVEAAQKVYGRYSRWILFTSLGLASYIYSLDASTTSAYLAFATSTFGGHSLISLIQVIQSIIIAVGKPVIAKVSDVTSRATAFLAVLIFYVLGYLVIASANNIGTIAAGIILYAIGYTGLQLLTQILIADITTLKWRGLVSSLVSMPFVLNGFIGPNISSAVLQHLGWRWGYGMFAVLVPATLLPLIITLFWAENKAKRLGLVERALAEAHAGSPTKQPPGESVTQRFKRVAEQLDLVGLILLGSSIVLVLLPLTLQTENLSDVMRIAMLVAGSVDLVAFAVWDLRFASNPVIAPRFVRNRSIIFACVIGFIDFMSFFLTFTYLYTFVLVVKPWSLLEAMYFTQVQTVALTVFAFAGGVAMWRYRRYKWLLVGGLCVRLLGVGLMIHSRGANASTAELVWTQILQGFGGGIAASAAQVGAQASVPHSDVAMTIATVLLLTEVGGAIGSATAGSIWSSTMPDNLAKYLPFLSDHERAELFGNIKSVLKIPRGDPRREGVIHAYEDTMKVMVVLATALSVLPILAALFMPNWYLGDKQNAVDSSALTRDETDETIPYRAADDQESSQSD